MVKGSLEHLYTYNNANQLTRENISGPAVLPITVTGTVSDATGISSLTINGTSATLEGENFTCPVTLSSGANTLTISATDLIGNTAVKTVNVTYDNQAEQVFYLYDNNGNLIRKQSAAQTLNLGYDYENRLTSTASAGMNISYSYDGEGKRISTEGGSTLTKYIYDGMDVIAELNIAGDTVASYLRNPYTAGGIGGIISAKQGTAAEMYYSYDGLGSTANLSDPAGVNLQSYSYDAFGNLFNQSTVSNSHQFLTKEADPTGLIYFGARYYDPKIGRFITQDPMGMIDGANLYSYCLNDPLNFVDLWGLCKEKSWGEKFQLYLTEVGAEMEKGFMTNMQGLIGTIGVGAGAYANVGLIPKAIGYSNQSFFQGGRNVYYWANQYGSGMKYYSAGKLGLSGSALSIGSAIMLGWTLGDTINAYYWGALDYQGKYK